MAKYTYIPFSWNIYKRTSDHHSHDRAYRYQRDILRAVERETSGGNIQNDLYLLNNPGEFIQMDRSSAFTRDPNTKVNHQPMWTPVAEAIHVVTEAYAKDIQKRNILAHIEQGAGLEHNLVRLDELIVGELKANVELSKAVIQKLPKTKQTGPLRLVAEREAAVLRLDRQVDRETTIVELAEALVPSIADKFMDHSEKDENFRVISRNYLVPLTNYILDKAQSDADTSLRQANPDKSLDDLGVALVSKARHTYTVKYRTKWIETYIPRDDFVTTSKFLLSIANIDPQQRDFPAHQWSHHALAGIQGTFDTRIAAEEVKKKAAQDSS